MSAWGNALIWMFLFVCAPLQCCLPGWILWCRHLCKYSLLCMPSSFPPGVILFTSLLRISLLCGAVHSLFVGPGRASGLHAAGPLLLRASHAVSEWNQCLDLPQNKCKHRPPPKMASHVKLRPAPHPPPKKHPKTNTHTQKQKFSLKFSVWSVYFQFTI